MVRSVMVAVPAQPVVYVTHSVGTGQLAHVGHAPVDTYDVAVVGQQSVAHGTVTLDTRMYSGQMTSVGGGAHDSVGQVAVACVSNYYYFSTTDGDIGR